MQARTRVEAKITALDSWNKICLQDADTGACVPPAGIPTLIYTKSDGSTVDPNNPQAALDNPQSVVNNAGLADTCASACACLSYMQRVGDGDACTNHVHAHVPHVVQGVVAQFLARHRTVLQLCQRLLTGRPRFRPSESPVAIA
jgi:hypothetical protein